MVKLFHIWKKKSIKEYIIVNTKIKAHLITVDKLQDVDVIDNIRN